MKTSSFENFPWWMVAIGNAVGLAIYAIGLYLMGRLGIVWGLLCVVYCVCVEWRILSGMRHRDTGFNLLCRKTPIMIIKDMNSQEGHALWLPVFLVEQEPKLVNV